MARLHYEHDLTKQEIARRLGVSRFKVARLLDEAREQGAVRFVFDDAGDAGPLARALEDAFGLDLAIVVPGRELAPAAAALLAGLVGPDTVLGVGWGDTVASVVEALPLEVTGTPVVQICGAVPGLEPGTGPTEVAARLAHRMGGRLFPLPAPAFASRSARDELLGNETVAPTVAMFDRVTVALVGVGAHPRGGHVLTQVFDRDGLPAVAGLAERAIAMDADGLRRARTLAVAGGVGKEDAVRGALRSGLVRLVVTDERCAEAALA